MARLFFTNRHRLGDFWEAVGTAPDRWEGPEEVGREDAGCK